MFKVNNEGSRMTSVTSFWFLIVNFEYISYIFLGFLMLTKHLKINVCWEGVSKLFGIGFLMFSEGAIEREHWPEMD